MKTIAFGTLLIFVIIAGITMNARVAQAGEGMPAFLLSQQLTIETDTSASPEADSVEWTEEDKKALLVHMAQSFENLADAENVLGEKLVTGEPATSDETWSYFMLLQKADRYAERVREDSLRKVYPEFADYFRDYYKGGLRSILWGFQQQDWAMVNEGCLLYNEFRSWVDENYTNFKYPPAPEAPWSVLVDY